MPLLVYTSSDFPFQPFTKIYSADINQCYNDIKTLLNVTKLDHTNVQAHGLTRLGSASNLIAGTASYAVFNDSNGDLSEAAQLPTAQGGLGFNATPSGIADAGKVVAVNPSGSALQLQTVPSPPAQNVSNYYFYA